MKENPTKYKTTRYL